MSTQELIHKEDFVEHLASKWSQKMFFAPRSGVYQILGQWLCSALQDLQHAKVMEIGYGSGDFTKTAEENSLSNDFEYTGVDISEDFQKFASNRLPTLNFTLGNGTILDFEDDHFDLAFTVDVLRHNENWKEMLSEFSRVTRREVFISDIFAKKADDYQGFIEGTNEFHSGHSHQWGLNYFVAEAEKHFKHVSVIPIPGFRNKGVILSNENTPKRHAFHVPIHVAMSNMPVRPPLLIGRDSKLKILGMTAARALKHILRSTVS